MIGATKGDIPKTKAIEELLARGIETGVRAVVPKTPVPTKALQKVEAKDFVFELQSCKLSGGNIRCSLLVTNKAGDREVGVNASTRIFDNFGNKYVVDEPSLQIGNLRGTRYLSASAWAGGQREDRWATAKLITGVPTRMILNFSGVSPEATSIALLEISCLTRAEGEFVVKLRNIPLSR